MLTTRWQPLGTAWPEINRLQKEMEQWFGRLGMNDPRQFAGSVYPPLSPRHSDVKFLHGEYGIGDFHRTFTVGEAIDTERISAGLKNGVVTVHLPKSEKVKPRRIKVTCC